MSERTARGALREALADWRRHAGALAIVVAAFAAAAVISRPEAQYAAYLLTFCVWMMWFILTTIEWVRRAEF